MKRERINNYLLNFTEQKLASGKLFFTQEEFKNKFSSYSKAALVSSLNRLIKKGKITSIHKGFYLIIPPDRMAKGMLPPTLFIDSLMSYLNRVYYIGLLSAAVYYGAAHQQAQEYFVFINKPPLRKKKKNRLNLNFVVKSNIPQVGIEKRKTETGYVNISSAELTAIDLVKYQSNIGGLNRAVSILFELSEEVQTSKLRYIIDNENISTATLQRLGYIFDKLNKRDLAQVVYSSLVNRSTFRIPLKTDADKRDFNLNKKWKIVENIELDLEF